MTTTTSRGFPDFHLSTRVVVDASSARVVRPTDAHGAHGPCRSGIDPSYTQTDHKSMYIRTSRYIKHFIYTYRTYGITYTRDFGRRPFLFVDSRRTPPSLSVLRPSSPSVVVTFGNENDRRRHVCLYHLLHRRSRRLQDRGREEVRLHQGGRVHGQRQEGASSSRASRSIDWILFYSIDRSIGFDREGDGTIARVTTKTRGFVRVMRAMDV